MSDCFYVCKTTAVFRFNDSECPCLMLSETGSLMSAPTSWANPRRHEETFRVDTQK